MLFTSPNVPVRLVAVASDGSPALFCRASLYDSSGSPVSTVSMPHTISGIYAGSYTFTVDGQYGALYKFYVDAGFTTPAPYDQAFDHIDVSSYRENILRILGLLHENTVVDMQTYNGNNQLTSARIRSYDSKTNANAAGVTGLLHTWTVTASYTGSNLSLYKIVLDS